MVALIGAIDLRAVVAVDAGRLLAGDRLTALHVIEPGEDVPGLAARWMQLRCSSVPLRTVEPLTDRGDSELAVAEAVIDAVTPADPTQAVTVVLAHLELATRRHRWLHRRTADRIAGAIEGRPDVELIRIPVPVEAP